MHEMVIYGVSFDMVGKQPIVLLKTLSGNSFLPIWIGHPEAASILMRLQGAQPPRPATHDLFTKAVDDLGASITRVGITELRDNTFVAEVVLDQGGTEITLDARPSDALALAVRVDAPIFAAPDVLATSSVEFEHGSSPNHDEMVEQFRSFLDDVSPDDFLPQDN